MKYLVFDLNKKKFIASAIKTLQHGYQHTFDYYIDWTPLFREAKHFGFKEAKKWAEHTNTAVIIKTAGSYEIILDCTKAG